jgi:hypothetical protein
LSFPVYIIFLNSFFLSCIICLTHSWCICTCRVVPWGWSDEESNQIAQIVHCTWSIFIYMMFALINTNLSRGGSIWSFKFSLLNSIMLDSNLEYHIISWRLYL